jgi:hypothetical protein
MEGLTKDNFWDDLQQEYPGPVEAFKKWIDLYKRGWQWEAVRPELKFHDLAMELQYGILMRFFHEQKIPDAFDPGVFDREIIVDRVRQAFARLHLIALAQANEETGGIDWEIWREW